MRDRPLHVLSLPIAKLDVMTTQAQLQDIGQE
jgi:hypothetical protein